MAIFGVAYSPLRVSVGMQVTEGVLTQEYDPGSSEYMPDRRIRPTAVLPVVRVSDPSGFLEDGAANTLLADIFWYEGEASDGNAILDSNPDYDIDRTGDDANRGRITVYKNVPFNRPLTLVFKAVLVDMAGGKVRRKANVMGSVNLTTSTASTAPLVLARGYPRGNLYNIMDKCDLRLSARLMAGTEEVPSAFWWYKKEGNKLTPLEDLEGARTGELTVPVSLAGRRGKFAVKAQDCRKELKALQDEWLDGELEKIREWPRNLIAKQYMMDWNDVKAGLTEKGEDADGEYLRVIWSYLNDYVNNKYGDMFMGKADYQPGTRYVLRVKWKRVSGTGSSMFTFKYSDGTRDEYVARIPAGVTTVYESTFTTSEGKTVSGILALYDTSVTVNVYEISLTEHGGAENLIEESGEVRVTAGAENIYAAALLPIAKTFKAGDKLTLSVGEVRNLAGNPDKYSVFLQHAAGLTQVSNGMLMAKDSPFVVFTLNDRYDPAQPVRLVMYAGVAGSTAGNDVVFEEVMLVEGEYTEETMPAYRPKWIPSAEDLAAEAGNVTLPEGYRPSSQGETVDGEYDLALRMPGYTTRVVTPWGDDKGVVMLPPSVRLFPAWIQVDTPAGTLDNPEEYFSADWRNGMKGMRVLLDAEQIGTGTMVVEPEVLEDLSKARYGVGGANGDASRLEGFENGTRVVVEIDTSQTQTGYLVTIVDSSKMGIGVLVNGNHDVLAYIHFGDTGRCATTLGNVSGQLCRVEFLWDGEPANCGLSFNGVEKRASTAINEQTRGNAISFLSDGITLLAEIYSPDGTLLHKWDMEGETDDERLADKAVTENPINLAKGSGFKLTPI